MVAKEPAAPPPDHDDSGRARRILADDHGTSTTDGPSLFDIDVPTTGVRLLDDTADRTVGRVVVPDPRPRRRAQPTVPQIVRDLYRSPHHNAPLLRRPRVWVLVGCFAFAIAPWAVRSLTANPSGDEAPPAPIVAELRRLSDVRPAGPEARVRTDGPETRPTAADPADRPTDDPAGGVPADTPTDAPTDAATDADRLPTLRLDPDG
ncbi:MAG: hypothetical protein AAGD35_05835 [Actinomycetota bacterium]